MEVLFVYLVAIAFVVGEACELHVRVTQALEDDQWQVLLKRETLPVEFRTGENGVDGRRQLGENSSQVPDYTSAKLTHIEATHSNCVDNS